MNCNKGNGAIYIQIIIPEIEATVAGEQHYNVKIGDVLNAFG